MSKGGKIRKGHFFADLPSIRPKWPGSERILINSAPNDVCNHHVYRVDFGIFKKTIRKTYKTAPAYTLNILIKWLKHSFDT